MEKLRIGIAMSTRWTDPPMMLMGIIPYAGTAIGISAYHAVQLYKFAAASNFSTSIFQGDELNKSAVLLAGMLGPYVLTRFLWDVVYHGLGTEKGVDTSKFLTFKKESLARYYKHRRIPMCELYEMYIDGHFDWNESCEGGDCYKILQYHRHEFANYKVTWRQIWWLISQFLPWWMTGSGLGRGSSSGKSVKETHKEIDEHYNKGNDVFSSMLGRAMVYTCGVFHQVPSFASDSYQGDYAKSAADGTLEEAQFNKLNMICDKLMLQKGETLLDIGCGWGTLCRHAVKHYGAKATGVTLSVEGKKYCDYASKETGIPTEIHCCDYREIPGGQKFDKIASIEMAEHVGIANFVDPFLVSVRKMLAKKDSKFLLQVNIAPLPHVRNRRQGVWSPPRA
eukprot:768732-Hanusia_phi.AAC.4